ncbi:hypothetical protein [Streptomyces massasporeus]|uniref:hypothetical protein n=1 Tax=Streptomyces massasporeus TaxID=67324 RepID=UPI00380A7F28
MSHRPTGPACGNNPNFPMSDGDRQAVADFKAYLAERAELRDRIAEALDSLQGAAHHLPPETRRRVIEAVAGAVLPAAAGRAAGLREAADFVDNDDDCGCGGCDSCIPRALAADLRRMADEAQPTEAYPPMHRWRVELFDYLAEEWVPGGTRWPYREQAAERYELMKAKAPAWKDGTPVQRRIVRETTTYTVEAQQDEAQP